MFVSSSTVEEPFGLRPAKIAAGILNLFSSPIVMRSLPPPPPLGLIGRVQCVNDILEQVTGNGSECLALFGPPGIGKTALALEVVHDEQIERKYGGCRHWIDCKSIASPTKLLHALPGNLRALIPNQRKSQPHDHAMESNLPQLLVLDHVGALWDCSDGQTSFNSILRGLCEGGVRILCTTASPPSTNFWQLRVPTLLPADARDLFIQNYALAVDVEPELYYQLGDLLELVDGVPSAIITLANTSKANDMLPADLLKRLRVEPHEYLEFNTASMPFLSFKDSVCSWLDDSTVKIDPEILGILSFLPNGADESLLSHMGIALNDKSIRAMSAALHEPSTCQGRYQLLKPFRAFFLRYNHLSDAPREKLYAYYYGLGRESATCQIGDDNFKRLVRLFLAESSNMEFVLDDALQRGRAEAIDAALGYSHLLCSVPAFQGLMRKAISLCRQKSLRELELQCLRRVGEMVTANGHRSTELDEAAGGFHDLGDFRSEAFCYMTSGPFDFRCNAHDRGIATVEKARDIFKQLGDARHEVECKRHLAEMYMSHNRREEGMELLQSVMSQFEEWGDRLALARCRLTMASLETFEELEVHSDLARLLSCVNSLAALERAVSIYQRLDMALDAAFAMRTLATEYLRTSSKENIKQAALLFRRARDLFAERTYVYGEGECQYSGALAHLMDGNAAFAFVGFDLARSKNARNGDALRTSLSLLGMIACHAMQHRAAPAAKLLKEHEKELESTPLIETARNLVQYAAKPTDEAELHLPLRLLGMPFHR